MTRWQRDELVAARADAILAGARTAEAYAGHFEAQVRLARCRAWICHGLLALLRARRRPNMLLLAVLTAVCALFGFAAASG